MKGKRKEKRNATSPEQFINPRQMVQRQYTHTNTHIPRHTYTIYTHQHTYTIYTHQHTYTIYIPQHTYTIYTHQHTYTIYTHQHTYTRPFILTSLIITKKSCGVKLVTLK